MAMQTLVIEDFQDIMDSYDPLQNKTNNILYKYEKVAVIGARAAQIQRGAPPYVMFDKSKPFDAREIAKKELYDGKIPFMIARKLPDGKVEHWRLDDMLIM
jgi:DNA-directed RNA polymerase subunit K/omega